MAPNEQKPGVLGTRPPTPTGGGQGANEPRVRVRSPYSDQSGGALPAWFTEEMTLGEMLDAGKRLSTGEIARLQKALYLAGYYRGTSDSNPLGRPPRWGYWDGDTKQAYQSLIGEQMGEYEGVGSGYMPAGTTRTLDELLGERMAYYAEDAKKAAAVGAGDLGTKVISTVDPATVEAAARSHARDFLGRDLTPGEVQSVVSVVTSQDYQAKLAAANASRDAELGAIGRMEMAGGEAGRYMMPTTVVAGPPDGTPGNASTVANGIAGAFGGIVERGWSGPGQNGQGDPRGLEFTLAVNGQSIEQLQAWLTAQTGDGKLIESFEVDGNTVDQDSMNADAAAAQAKAEGTDPETVALNRGKASGTKLGVADNADLDTVLAKAGIEWDVSDPAEQAQGMSPDLAFGGTAPREQTIRGDANKILALFDVIDARAASDPVFANFAKQIASGEIKVEPDDPKQKIGWFESSQDVDASKQVTDKLARPELDKRLSAWREGMFGGKAGAGAALGGAVAGDPAASAGDALGGAAGGEAPLGGPLRRVKLKLREGAGVPDFAKVGFASSDEKDWRFLDSVMRKDTADPWAWDHGGIKRGAFGMEESLYRRVAAEHQISNSPTYTADEQRRVAKAYVEDLRKRYGDDWHGIAHAWLTSSDVVDRWHASKGDVNTLGRPLRDSIDRIYTGMMSGSTMPSIDSKFGDTFGYGGEKLSQFTGGGVAVVEDVDPSARAALEMERQHATEGQANGTVEAMAQFQRMMMGGG